MNTTFANPHLEEGSPARSLASAAGWSLAMARLSQVTAFQIRKDLLCNSPALCVCVIGGGWCWVFLVVVF